MKKHEHPTNRLEKMSNFFGGGNFSKLNLYVFQEGAEDHGKIFSCCGTAMQVIYPY